jgi:hypothetical protein
MWLIRCIFVLYFTTDEISPVQLENSYTLRFGITGNDHDPELISAMIEVTETWNQLIGRRD